jgi:hypothetical protein
VFTDSADIYFPNKTTAADVDVDGDIDLIVPYGFLACEVFFIGRGPCGGLAWFESRGDAWVRHDIVPPNATLFYSSVLLLDVDRDGIRDLVTVGERMKVKHETPQWFKGVDTVERFERSARVMGEGLGSFPQAIDVDGDGDVDLASAEFFLNEPGFAWFERVKDPLTTYPAGVWARHVIGASGLDPANAHPRPVWRRHHAGDRRQSRKSRGLPQGRQGSAVLVRYPGESGDDQPVADDRPVHDLHIPSLRDRLALRSGNASRAGRLWLRRSRR